MIEGAIIQQVLARFGTYSASLEREYIRSQQRTPEPDGKPVAANYTDARRMVTQSLRAVPGWWTGADLSAHTGLTVTAISYALHAMVSADEVERFYPPVLGRRAVDKPQLYRWVQK